MPANLYEALGIRRNASIDEVRTALRVQIRRHYAKSQRGTGNVEEALRLINQASHTLLDPKQRAQYDRELMLGGGALVGVPPVPADDRQGGVARPAAESTQSADAGDTSEPQPWRRCAARLLDYALWGLVLVLTLQAAVESGGAAAPEMLRWLTHPLLVPVVVAATWVPLEALLVALARTTPGKWLFGVRLRFAISDAYAGQDASRSLGKAARRAVQVWWQGVAAGILPLLPVAMAVAYRRLVRDGETAWDSDGDCLVTQRPFGLVGGLGVLVLIALAWVYGNVWREPLGRSLDWAQARWTVGVGSKVASLIPGGGPVPTGDGQRPSVDDPVVAGTGPRTSPPAASTSAGGNAKASSSGAAPTAAADAPIDPQLAALFAQRKARIAAARSEGLAQLEARNFARATAACREWSELELGNAQAWRCYGLALEGLGQHREAIAALRRAKQYDPTDSTIDADISRSQAGVVADFRSRGGQ